MDINLSADSWQVLVAFGLYLFGSVAIGIGAHVYLKRGSFMEGYFLGHRGLGPWMLALTVAATAISGGTFMGFPSLIYSHGWVMCLWICSYMVVPLTTMALLGKRINQAARIAGSVTVPDVLRDRFDSPALGILSSSLILLFLAFNLVAQFKGGGLLMKEAMRLPPAKARFLGAESAADHMLHLTFALPDGTQDVQKTPFPSNKAIYLKERTEVDESEREVRVYFRLGQEVTHKHVKFPPQQVKVPWLARPVELGYLIGLIIFALTVVAYTTYGGFWAVTLTDLLAGLVMFAGVILMAILAMQQVPPTNGLTGLPAATETLRYLEPPEGKAGDLVYGPGPGQFLSVGLAFSFFLMWSLMSAGQPSGMVRLMSFKDSPSLRRALLLVCSYYFVIYLALVIIFVCARALFPTQYLREVGSEGEPDSIMPAMVRHLAHPLVAGFLLAAPYAAIMSTVAAFLLMISSSLVRDLYQRTFNPKASNRSLKAASYGVTALVGVVVMVGAINPPGFLQYIIVFTGSGQGCSFLLPMALALYWRRSTRQGVFAGMLGGFVAVFGLYVLGWIDSYTQAHLQEHHQAVLVAQEADKPAPEEPGLERSLQNTLGWFPGWGEKRPDSFAPLYPAGLDPLVWGLLFSLILTVGVSLCTRPDEERARRYFPEEPAASA